MAALTSMELPTPTTAASDSADDGNEYGLRDLATLPLLEQVHRLFHAIQQQYPYKETTAWKTLPLDQKRRMLEYIRERRSKGESLATAPPQPTLSTTDSITDVTTSRPPSSVPSAKTDPYLQMLQKRTLATPAASSSTQVSGTYVAGQPRAAKEYVVDTRPSRSTFTARWKVLDSEFYEDPVCACGKTHGSSTAPLETTMQAMLSTFGDVDRPCLTAVKRVKGIVGAYLRDRLEPLTDDGELHAPCLRTLVEIFSEEAAYYGRWREFRGETKQQETDDLEVVEEDDLADELDLFAVSEADVFNEAFLERIRFADERTRGMDWSNYHSFAKSRKLNFMAQRGGPLKQWLGITGSCSRASLEFINFVAYHNIGRLVEAAIKARTGGRLEALTSPLLKADIDVAIEAFKTDPQYQPDKPNDADDGEDVRDQDDNDNRPNKLRRTDDGHTASTTTAGGSSTTESSSSASVDSAVPQRLIRLKRLR